MIAIKELGRTPLEGVRIRYRDPLGDWWMTEVGPFREGTVRNWAVIQIDAPETTVEGAQQIGRAWLAEQGDTR